MIVLAPSPNQVTAIVSIDDPLIVGMSAERLYDFTRRPEADVNPFSMYNALHHPIGFVAVSLQPNHQPEPTPLEIVGYAGYTKVRVYEDEGFPQIGNVALLPEFQGLGIGRGLVRQTFDTMRAHGIGRIAAVCNQFSRPIFEDLGFELAGTVVSDRKRIKPLYLYDDGQVSVHRVE